MTDTELKGILAEFEDPLCAKYGLKAITTANPLVLVMEQWMARPERQRADVALFDALLVYQIKRGEPFTDLAKVVAAVIQNSAGLASPAELRAFLDAWTRPRSRP